MVSLTDANQQAVAEYAYDAYGNTLRASGAMANVNAYRYSTKEYQAASGLYDYGFRFYSPGLGRWLNRDPIKERGGLNVYGFVGNNPVNNVDTRGLGFRSFCEGVIKDVGDYFRYRGNRAFGNPNQLPNPTGNAEDDSEERLYRSTTNQFFGAGAANIDDGLNLEMSIVPAVAGAGTAGMATTARVAPANLAEQLTMAEAKAGAGDQIMAGTRFGDPLYNDGNWIKMQHVHVNPDGSNIVVHYMKNVVTGATDQYKFK